MLRKIIAVPRASRTTREVLEDHIELRRRRSLELDLSKNFAGDVVVLTSNSEGKKVYFETEVDSRSGKTAVSRIRAE